MLGRTAVAAVLDPINDMHSPVAVAVVYEARGCSLHGVDATEQPQPIGVVGEYCCANRHAQENELPKMQPNPAA